MHKKIKFLPIFMIGLISGIVILVAFERGITYTSGDHFCNSCHAHPQAALTWKRGSHFDNKRGMEVHCVQCHLPPGGISYYTEKARTGMRDIYSSVFKDASKINWNEKSTVAAAARHTFMQSCLSCHMNLFPIALSKEGREAHLYFSQLKNEIACTNCHLNVGHYNPEAKHAKNLDFGKPSATHTTVYSKPAQVQSFQNFTETLPGTPVSFDMMAVPGGNFIIGSPADESYRKPDEGPQHEVKISSFFMGKLEVSWDEYMTFFSMTSGERKSTGTSIMGNVADAISGPTPPWGAPDQGWGKGSRPAITMTWHAAETYCCWLSQITGKKYRLPTEAEWEYAARGGIKGPYFFNANPGKLSSKSFKNRLLGRDTSVINSYVVYAETSKGKTGLPTSVMPNSFGLKNMLGNVAEICSDWYAENTYETYSSGLVMDPKGPAGGTEKVIRGGSYLSDASDVRSAARDHTQTQNWLKTDPQMPKSIWWYSDCNYVGFRVVCETSCIAEIKQENGK